MAEDLMDKVFSFFSGEGLTDEKQNMLKGIARELSQSKFAKFFRVRTEEADPSLLSFLFSVYKTVYPIKMFMRDEKKVSHLRYLIVDTCLDGSIKEIANRLDTAALDAKAKTMSGEQLIAAIQTDISLLTSQYDVNHINNVNHRYELASALIQFIGYNFPGFFKKFDSHFADGSFIIEPKFPAVKAILIIDQIGEFLTATQALKPEEDWKGLLGLLKTVEGQDIVNPEQFTTMIKNLREIHTSKILELMCQYTLRNPVWQWKHTSFHETIGEAWLESKICEANGYISKINNAKKNSQINALTKEIFESTDLLRVENYSVQLGDAFRRKNLEGYLYAEGLNYLKAFMDDYIDKEIKELCDILLIRGQWTNNTMSREMSESLHELFNIPARIADFDVVLSEDGADGSRLRAGMLRIDRDPTQARMINAIVSKVNSEAQEMINESVQALIVIGKHLKVLIEDVQKKHPELLINWREVNLVSKDPLSQRMVNSFKKINYFVQLMHLCTQ